MKDDLKKYINLAYNLDDLILKSLLKVDKSKLYESFMNGHLLFEQTNTDSNELSSLKTSGITDTGTTAPFTEAPYTGLTETMFNQRKQSNLHIYKNLRRPWGDPYIYFSATSGNLFTYKCGKNDNKAIVPCPQINATDWKDANSFRNDILKLVFTDTPNIQQEGNQQDNAQIIKKFRNDFYLTYAWFIANKGGSIGKIKANPMYPKYETTIEYIDAFETKLYKINLVQKTATEGFVLNPDLIKKSVKHFVTKKIELNGIKYKFDTIDKANMLFAAATIFDGDSTGYVNDVKAKEIINEQKLGIYKVE